MKTEGDAIRFCSTGTVTHPTGDCEDFSRSGCVWIRSVIVIVIRSVLIVVILPSCLDVVTLTSPYVYSEVATITGRCPLVGSLFHPEDVPLR